MDLLHFLPAAAFGYLIFQIITHPESIIWQKLPPVKTRRVQVFPSIRLVVFNRTIHFHHWFNFAILLGFSAFASSSFLDHSVTRGILFGGMIQGLSVPASKSVYPPRKLIYRNSHIRRPV